MTRGKSHNRGSSGHWMKFVFYPIILAALTIAIILAMVFPVVSPYGSIVNAIFNRQQPTFEYGSNIFEKALAINKDTQVIKTSDIRFPTFGDQYGVIKIDSVSINTPVFFGDTGKQFKSGAGSYTGAYLPGQGRPILIGAHNNTFFKGLSKVKIGDTISFATNYGDYVYEITLNENGRFDDTKYYDLKAEEETLILYTCYQSIRHGATPYRTFVHAKYISGPKLVM